MLLTPKKGSELLIILEEKKNKKEYGRIIFNYYKRYYCLIFKNTDVFKEDLLSRSFLLIDIKTLLPF
jgi:hypothetical protein